MPIGAPQGNLDIKNATLRTSNLETQNIKIGSIFVGTGNSLEETANVGNSMSNTIQFTNTHTAFTTTGNVSVGKELTVTGDVTVDTDTLHVDSTNNRVGVGTASPDTTLDVNGTITGRIVGKTRTITKGTSLSGEVDTFTLGNGENRIILDNAQGSVSSSRTYTANFTSGVPTEIGSILYLEINSSRTNSNSSAGVNHKSEIQFNGTTVLSTYDNYIDPSGSYSRTLKRQIIYTSNGWRDLFDRNVINTGSTGIPALTFDRGASGNYRTEIYQDAYGADFRVGYGGYTPASLLYLKRYSNGGKEIEMDGTLTGSAINGLTRNFSFYNNLGSDGAWRSAFTVGTTAIGLFSVLSYSSGHSQSSALWFYQYKNGGTSGDVVRITGSSSPNFRFVSSSQTIEHNGNGGTHFTQLRVFPFEI